MWGWGWSVLQKVAVAVAQHFVLLETGDSLLLEDGDKVILEVH